MHNNDSADDILNHVYDNFENTKKLKKEQYEKEKERCDLLIEQIKNESDLLMEQIKNKSDKILELNIQLFNKFQTPEGEAFISKMTKGREEVRNALLNSIEKLEKHVKAQKNIKFTDSFTIFKYNLIELNRTYYNSFEFMSYLMFK